MDARSYHVGDKSVLVQHKPTETERLQNPSYEHLTGTIRRGVVSIGATLSFCEKRRDRIW